MRKQSILVNGGGIAGLIMAHALSRLDVDVTLIEPYPPALKFKDEKNVLSGRTAMILSRHIDWLRSIGAWNADVDSLTALLATMRIIEDSISDKPAVKPVDFCAGDLKQVAFGYNTPLKMYRAFLWDHLPSHIRVLNETDHSPYDLKIAADGRNSPLRDEAHIKANFDDCGRSALTFAIKHSWQHNHISTEIQKSDGPVTLVPLSDPHQSSVVFTGESNDINSLKNKDKIDISNILYKLFENSFPDQSITVLTDIECYPLSFMSVEQLYKDNIVLTAEAAHVLHPMGAQGLNLSIGDMHVLYDLISKALATGQSIAHEMHVLKPYAQQRARAHAIRHISIQSSLDMLEKGNITGRPRRLILSVLRKSPLLKKVLMTAQK